MGKNYTDQEFIETVKSSDNIRQVCKKLNILAYGGNYQFVKRKIKKMNLDTSHFGKNPQKRKKQFSFTLDQILIQGSFFESTTKLKKKLLKNNLLKEECYSCHRSTYQINDKIIKMPLQLHHIDGDRENNELNNLILLCPICHSITSNYRGGNKKKNKIYINCSKCGKRIRKNKFGLCRNCYIESKNLTKDHQKTKAVKNKQCIKCGKNTTSYITGLCKDCYNNSIRKTEKPSKEVLLKLLDEQSIIRIAKKYNCSDGLVRKWCKKYGIDTSLCKGGFKRKMQALEKGRITIANKTIELRICPKCGGKKNSTSKLCKNCYNEERIHKQHLIFSN